MKLDMVVRELHRSEHRLARDLSAVSARHHADHEIHHVAHDLAGWSHDHLRQLEAVADRLDIALHREHRARAWTAPLQERLSELLRTRPETSMMLLLDLRHLHRVTAGVSLDWELLGQGAQAVKKPDLLELAQHCHPQTVRQLNWTNSMLKILSPQVLAT
ncbi:hypothetical protein [Nocardia donostiensis]|uniref:Uncharacterized protein n=1 Tax=Nocardia donostiensis TaxID=1538463 RepID=A0A1V2TKP5_9NOCA|nr:hypothetical protein [Nocardia donostiensis]ONM50062.1 hypothetical protein B0T46_02900 [Nocardia donostiensis]OQS15724.1 hypothetical protein B0T36_06995 [Nocardia donostiensis]OQS19428.1 hypothetical protein B0T44_14635 [Nocardia donostiensis]